MIKVKRGGSRPFGRKFFPDVKKITSELQDKDGKIIEGVGILYGIEEVKFVGFPIAYVKSLEVKI